MSSIYSVNIQKPNGSWVCLQWDDYNTTDLRAFNDAIASKYTNEGYNLEDPLQLYPESCTHKQYCAIYATDSIRIYGNTYATYQVYNFDCPNSSTEHVLSP